MHSLLENYLAEVARQLGSLPVKRRDEELWEMRQHLTSTIEAYQELGETEKEAVEATLRRFGSPMEAASGLTRVWRRGHRSWGNVTKGALFGFVWFWSVYGLFGLFGHYLERHPNALPALRPYCEPLGYALLFGFSALLGILSRGRADRRGMAWGVVLSYAGPIVVDAALQGQRDVDVLGTLMIVTVQVACLTGAAWAAGWRRPMRMARH